MAMEGELADDMIDDDDDDNDDDGVEEDEEPLFRGREACRSQQRQPIVAL